MTVHVGFLDYQIGPFASHNMNFKSSKYNSSIHFNHFSIHVWIQIIIHPSPKQQVIHFLKVQWNVMWESNIISWRPYNMSIL